MPQRHSPQNGRFTSGGGGGGKVKVGMTPGGSAQKAAKSRMASIKAKKAARKLGGQ